jgi:hypothetical protein
MTESEFTQFLVDEIDAGNETFVTDLLTVAKAKVTAGGGVIGNLTSGTVNAKSFTKQISMNAAVVAKCCRNALIQTSADENTAGVAGTCLDFRGLHGG